MAQTKQLIKFSLRENKLASKEKAAYVARVSLDLFAARA